MKALACKLGCVTGLGTSIAIRKLLGPYALSLFPRSGATLPIALEQPSEISEARSDSLSLPALRAIRACYH